MTYPVKAYIPCCDASLPIVKISSFLFNKFWPDLEVNYLGFSAPEFEFYNYNHKFHSLAPVQEGGAQLWTRYIHNFLKEVEADQVMFFIDDYWVCQEPNIDLVNKAHELMKVNEKIGRFDLTFDSQVEGNMYPVKSLTNGIHVKHPKAPYRVSTQPAIWRLSYLLEILDNDWSPWEFELLGTNYAQLNHLNKNHTFAFSDDEMVDYPVRTVAKGAVSRHNLGKVNVLGFSVETIKEMVQEGFFTEKDLIWGQWEGAVPSFHDLGGYDFHPLKMPIHAASLTDWKEYHSIYKSEKLLVNVFDRTFSHTKELWGYISANGTDIWGKPNKVEYIFRRPKYEGVTLFVDDCIANTALIKAVKSKYKVGWIIEPRDVKRSPYLGVDLNHKDFDLIITFDKELIRKYDNCKHLVWCESRMPAEHWGIGGKTKHVSMIASKKKITEGHRFRFDIASQLGDKHAIDLWGSAFKEFSSKTQPLKDYRFSIVVNNSKQDSFFTEALCDCFAV